MEVLHFLSSSQHHLQVQRQYQLTLKPNTTLLTYQEQNIKMVFSTLTAAAAFSFFSLVSSAPTSSPIYPPTSLSQNFRLVANVTSGPLLINNYVLTSYHTGAGEAFAVLQPNTTVTSGRIFYVNGTATDVRYNQANVLSDEGTPLYPGGVLINPPNEAGERAVSINAGSGEAGIGLTNFPNPIKELYAGEGAGFYACDNELEYGEAVQVLFREL